MTNGLFGAKGQNNDWFVFENALEKDAKRIVACVNACAGIDAPEQWVAIAKTHIEVSEAQANQNQRLKAEIEQLKAQLNQ